MDCRVSRTRCEWPISPRVRCRFRSFTADRNAMFATCYQGCERGAATFYELPGIPDGGGAGGPGRGQNANPVDGRVRDIHLSGGVHSYVAWVSQLGVTGWAIISGEAHNAISRY